MAPSQIELVKANLITGLETISVAGGYRNNIQSVGQVLVELSTVKAFPHIVVVFNDGSVDAITDNKATFQERQDVNIIGYVAAAGLSTINSDNLLTDAAESLIHDLKKFLTSYVITNIVSTTFPSLISDKKNMLRIRRLYADNASKGMIAVGFTLLMRNNQSSTF